MKYKLFISILFILFLSLNIVCASDNLTDISQVNEDLANHESSENMNCINVSGNTFEDIQKTINKAESDSIITLNDTYVGCGKEITINKPLTIEGKNSATLDANFTSKIFNITAQATLKNLNIINSRSITNGGAIISTGELTVINCNFTNNAVDSDYDWYFHTHNHNYELDEIGTGGAIYSTKDLSVINSVFIGNSAICNVTCREMDMYYVNDEGRASAIYCRGKLHLEKSRFSNNSKQVIDANNDSEIRECIFKNQKESFLNLEDSDTTFINCEFDNCGSDSSNYEIYLADGNVYIYDCNFTNMRTILSIRGNCEIANSNFINNSGYYGEESIIFVNELAKITNSTFINNYARDTAILELGSYKLNNCKFINNSDATILSDTELLDDSFNNVCLFEAKLVNKLSKVYYSSGKTISIKFVNIKTNEIRYYQIYDVYRNGKIFYDYLNGMLLEFPVSTWKAGTYNVVVIPENPYTTPNKLTFKVTVLKAPTIVKAPKITAKYKKSKYFKILVKNKVTKKVAKNLKIKVKVYTGKKYKTYTIKTDKKGIAKLNTKKLKIGKHKVIVSSGNSNYQLSAKSAIVIKR